jgi:hypothetical protein
MPNDDLREGAEMTDWLMVVITAIYVVATIAICVINWKAIRLSRNQIEQSNRPIVTIHFDVIRSGLMCFVIENEGKTAARDIAIRINDSFVENLPDAKMREDMRRLLSSKFYLASGQKLFITLDSQLHFDEVSSEVALIEISYGGKYETEASIDISQYSWMLVYRSAADDSVQHLKKISESLKKREPSANYVTTPVISSGRGAIIPIVEWLQNAQGKPQCYLSVLNDTNGFVSDLTLKFKHPNSQNEIWQGLQAYPVTSVAPGQRIRIGWISPTMAEPATAICEMSWLDSDGQVRNQATTV